MKQKEMNEENDEIKNEAYKLFEKHGFNDGHAFVDWLEAEKRLGIKNRSKRKMKMKNILFAILGVLWLIFAILLIMLFRNVPKMELSEKSLSELQVMMLVLDPQADEEVAAFGDTHFDYNKSTLTNEAKTLLDKEVQILKENPKMKVRMAGYTSAMGTEESNQELSEKRANAVKEYLIEKGVEVKRIKTIGYGETRPAVVELFPKNIDSKAARANMRVIFEIIVQ